MTSPLWNGSLQEGGYPRLLTSSVNSQATTTTTYVALHTHTLSNAQANNDYVVVEFVGYEHVYSVTNHASGKNAYLSVFVSTIQKSGDEVNTDEGHTYMNAGGSNDDGVYGNTEQVKGEVILVAGTDFTKGTGFVITIQGKTDYTNASAGVNRSYVWGFNTIV